MRVFLITGASSGIGAAAARALAAPDTAIAIHARKNRSGAERVAQQVGAAGAETLVLEGDLGQAGVGTRLVEETLLDLRERGRRVIPICPLVRRYIDRHPEFADLTVKDPDLD